MRVAVGVLFFFFLLKKKVLLHTGSLSNMRQVGLIRQNMGKSAKVRRCASLVRNPGLARVAVAVG